MRLTKIGSFLLMITLLSCMDETNPNPDSFPPVGRDEVALRSVRVLGYTGTKVQLELKMNMLYYYRYGLLCGDKAWGDYVSNYGSDLPASGFQLDYYDSDFGYQSVLKSVRMETPVPSSEPYSALVLVDNTLDFPMTEIEEPYSNRRFEALNYLFLNNTTPNNFALAAFGKNGAMGSDVKFCVGFNKDWQAYASAAIQLSETEGGTNNLVEALDESIDYIVQNGENPRKHIVVITHTNPDYEYPEFQAIVQKANSQQVAIHIIDMNFHPLTNLYGFSALSVETGGVYVSAGPAGNRTSEFGFPNVMIQFKEILNNLYQNYVINLEITHTGGDPNYFEKGFIYPHVFQMGYYESEDRTDCNSKMLLREFEYNYVPYAFKLQ